ncbi:TetR/AcrR family transcriptional regulator [Sporichthya brevicatena]|uniref:TetR/AcrR family transcriptional regulator n=1 Tax=Sporichthya brevicatena TaxID=171442 RepID=A0ABN1GC60_9ACTN
MRTAILAAAEELFAERGFPGTSTKAIAERAEVSEALVFTNFGTKAALFEAAVMDRYEAFVEAFMAEVAKGELEQYTTAFDLVHSFVEAFAKFLTENRSIVLSYLDYYRLAADDSSGPAANFALALVDLEQLLTRRGPELGLRVTDTRLAVRAIISMVLGLVLHEDLMFSGVRRPARARMLREITDLVVSGLVER